MIQLFTMTLCFGHLSQVAFNARHAREGPRSKKGAKRSSAQSNAFHQVLTTAQCEAPQL